MTIGVIGGLGHIGLPLSCLLQINGSSVVIIDENKTIFDSVSSGKPPFFEPNLNDNLKKAIKNGLQITDDYKKISECEYVVVTIGTSSLEKDKINFENLINKTIEILAPNSKLILRSTVDYGTCSKLLKNKILQDKNIKLAYCPERIAEGKAFEEIVKLPQIIGTVQKNFSEFEAFFNVIGTKTINVTYEEAEFIKLFSNVYRYSEFSLINEFKNISSKINLDFNRILEVATLDYPRLENVASPGFVGGPCLPKDTKTFVENFKQENNIIDLFLNTNEQFLENILTEIKKNCLSKKIIFLGITFKPESDDLRGSVSYELSKKLKIDGFEVFIVEPNIPDKAIEEMTYVYEDVKEESNYVIIGTNHKEFKNYDFKDKEVLKIGIK
tara:strand:- start:1497 stop:2648 length:1152 start_codon:yes stop_codon:yes gene_type:complete